MVLLHKPAFGLMPRLAGALFFLSFFAPLGAQVIDPFSFEGTVYVLAEGSGAGGSLKTVYTYPNPGGQGSITKLQASLAAYGNQVYVAEGVGGAPTKVIVVDGAPSFGSGSPVRVYTVGFTPPWSVSTVLDTVLQADARGVAVAAGRLLVASIAPPYFRAYDLATYQPLYTLDTTRVRSGREKVVVNAAGTQAALTGYFGDSIVSVIDLAAQDTLRTLRTASNPTDAAWNAAGDTLWVGCPQYTPTFSTNTVLNTFAAGRTPVDRDTVLNASGFAYMPVRRRVLFNGNSRFFAYTPSTGALDSLSGPAPGLYAFQVFAVKGVHELVVFSQTDFVGQGEVWGMAFGASSNYIGFVKGMYVIFTAAQMDVAPRSFAIQGAFNVTSTEAALAGHEPGLVAYPNPVRDWLWVDASAELPHATGTATLRDLSGRALLHVPVEGGHAALHVAGLPRGLYLVELSANGRTLRDRVHVCD